MKPRSFSRTALLTLVLAALSGCQTTGSRSFSSIAVSGLPLKLAHYGALNPDCSPIGQIVVRITKSPDNGSVSAVNGPGYTNFPASNPRHACNTQPTHGANLIYVAHVGYTGPDSLSVDVIYPVGQETQATFNLIVK